MRPAAWRLALAALVFAGWIAYLAYLAWTLPRAAGDLPLVLSRPQILVSDFDVVATVSSKEPGKVTIKQVLYPKSEEGKVGQEITVVNIAQCQAPKRNVEAEQPPGPDWTGPGDYLLPLREAEDGKSYEVVPIPTSPGYQTPGPPRIYPATPQALAQYRQIPKPQ